MFNRNNLVFAALAGVSAAAVAVLSIGGYFLHRKVLKYRLLEQAKCLVTFDMDDDMSWLDDELDEYDEDASGYNDELRQHLQNMDLEDND